MSANTLNDRSDGETIVEAFFNDIHNALDGDFVGRNSAGVPTSGQNLGTASIPWGTLRCGGIVINGASLDTTQVSAPPYRVTSGATRTTSNQPAFIIPNGAAASFVVDGTPTSLIYDVNGVSYTLSSDLTKSSLTTAPSSNNTCLVNDTNLAGAYSTRIIGEELSPLRQITIDTVGSEITSLDGKIAAFKVSTEVFLCRVDTTNNRLINCFRGFFYNSSLAPLNRVAISNNDTITLLKAGWVFLDSDGTTVDVSYTEPTYSFTSPSSPATGDYWYDFGNNLWKRYDGSTFQTVTRTLIGIVAMDSTNCIAARCVDFDATYKSDNNIEVSIQSTEIVRGSELFSSVNVSGNKIYFGDTRPTWNITTDLANSADLYSATEQPSREYFLYITDEGEEVISDIHPYYRRDFYGYYHPHNPWRCVGVATNDGSSNITQCRDKLYSHLWIYGGNGHGSTATKIRRFVTTGENQGGSFYYIDDVTNGMSITCNENMIVDISYTDTRTAGAFDIGFSLNSTQLTTSIATINDSDVIQTTQGTAAGKSSVSSTIFVRKGSVIRAHTDGTVNGGNNAKEINMRISKVWPDNKF